MSHARLWFTVGRVSFGSFRAFCPHIPTWLQLLRDAQERARSLTVHVQCLFMTPLILMLLAFCISVHRALARCPTHQQTLVSWLPVVTGLRRGFVKTPQLSPNKAGRHCAGQKFGHPLGLLLHSTLLPLSSFLPPSLTYPLTPNFARALQDPRFSISRASLSHTYHPRDSTRP